MPEITKQQLIDAGTDAQAFEDIVNGSAVINGDGYVDTRTGGPVKTISKVLADAQATLDDANNAASTIVNRFIFDNPTTMTSPGTGRFKLNNATIASATAIAIMATTNDTGNPSISNYLNSWDDSTNSTRGYIFLRKKGAPGTFAVFRITGALTDNTTWKQIPIAYVDGSGSWTDEDEFYIGFIRNGDASGGDLSSNFSSCVDGEIVVTSGTGGKTVKRANALTGFAKLISGVVSAQTDISNSDINASALIALSKLATQAANSVVANQTGSTAVPTANAISASKLYGRGASGNLGEITLGTGLSFSGSTLNAASLTLGSAQNTTSGSAIDFTGLSNLNTLDLMLAGVSGNNTAVPMIQFRASAAAVTSGYSGRGGYATSGQDAATVNGFGVSDNSNGTDFLSGTVSCKRMNGNLWIMTGTFSQTGQNKCTHGAVYNTLGSACDGIRLTSVGAGLTFDSGICNIQYS